MRWISSFILYCPKFLEALDFHLYISSCTEVRFRVCIGCSTIMKSLMDLINKLCKEFELWVAGSARFFAFHEMFDRIIKTSSPETRRQLLYSSIRTLLLGLLRCVITQPI